MLNIIKSSVLSLMLLISSIAPAATMTVADITRAQSIMRLPLSERSQISGPCADSAYGMCALRCISGSYSRL